MLISVFAIVIAYLFGSISSAIIVCKCAGLADPRSQGSKNPGATNVLRIGGKKAAAITLLGDLLKSLLPILLAKCLGLNHAIVALIALAAFFGHLFPIFFGFVGGKGVATFLGCLFGISWPVGITWLGSWLIIALLFRYSSLAAIIASLLAPLFIWYFTGNVTFISVIAIMAVILIYRHKTNIINLIAGKERKIGRK